MSYILDALKKADQERTAGDVPDLESAHDAVSRGNSGVPRWVWVVLVLLVVNGMLLVVLLDGNDAGKPQQAAEVIAAQPVSPVPPASVVPVPVSPATPMPQATPEGPVVSRPEPVIPKPVALPPPGPVQPAAIVPQPVIEPVRPPVEMAAVPLTPVIISQPAVMPQPTVGQESGRQETGVPYWAELPLDYRASFELPQLDVHVYSEIPAKRFILVNLRKYREGDELPDGIDLDEILPDGLLLTYNGRQFRMQK
jgi:general secretion pathway protein B